ncbi:cyclin-A2 isoform X1 [Salmo salar]|uniref:Cyclin-A2 n=1 Tax=Salmo salar TaxID=8030 RepID=B5X2Z3_SALSA|nr:cyclin-A2 [Salmo salar]XP_014054655.1 cyclin-A2 isoform X1 [Salmo salar]XP_014054656.1 cyclin-A2 isoform X1 [Salmo salar]ACI33674.1 Cyclin-A2 [Salmo salar]|eukprot:NP_001133671.1 cyclin-A2 [Salmo salar]
MSGSNQGQGSAVDVPLPEYQNQENMLSRLRGPIKHRADNQENIVPKAPQRTVLGGLQNNQCSNPQNTTQLLSCKNENEVPKSYAEKLGTKPPAFQIHLDEPDSAFSRERVSLKAKPSIEMYPLKLNPTVTCLRQPLASLDIPATCVSNMDLSFGDCPMDMSVTEGEEKPVDMNAVTEYASEIHAYLREMEVKSRPKAGYMKKQPDITYSMRAILVDWLVEVGEEYKLQNETLYLAVNYIDRFLSSMSVLRGKLQLVGTAAMLLASKFEEIYPPEVAEFVYITDDTYTKKQVLRMEHLVLKVLSFDLASPTINQFLTQYFLTQPVSNKVESLSRFLGELSLVDSDPFLKYLPSQTAAAAFVLANHTITGSSWSKSLAEVTGNSLEDLMPCIEDLHQMYLNAATHAQQSVREKYKGAKYQEVSLIEPPMKLSLN